MFSSLRKKDKGGGAASTAPVDVALIGCGPGGMAFLHALTQRKKEEGTDGPASKLNVTCFERAASAGGLWRDVPEDDPKRTKPENATLMYDDLCSNIPKELMEYYDYTFQDHFKKAAPVFLPRKDLLDYVIARNSVDGALDGVKYNHTVLSVTYDESSKKFNVEVRDDTTGKTSKAKYDKCIWAAGLHESAEKPDDIMSVLEEYEGKVLHSVEATEDFQQDVKGKKIMLVGDSSSAEDLALRAVKLGAKHVYICARSGDGECSDTKSWPSDKVTVVFGPPYKCTKGTSFKCQGVYWSEKRQRWRRDDEEDTVKLKDIATVVLCTGYEPNIDMIEDDIQYDDEETWEASKGWTMENNALTISVGNPSPSKKLRVGATCYPDLYRGLLIDNPSMMYLIEPYEPVSAFLNLDVTAHLLLAFLTGGAEIPKEKDMLKANQKQLEEEMQIPWFRLAIDPAYRAEIDELPEGHWSENADDERAISLNLMPGEFLVRTLARDMKACKYPLDLGDGKKLNKKGEACVKMIVASGNARSRISPEDKAWKTFRDVDPSQFASLHTGTPACALPRHFMDVKCDKGEKLTVATMK